jgi:hypothetical protein
MRMPRLAYNVDARKCLVDYVSEVFRLKRHTAELTAGTREVIATVDDILVVKAPPGWLWPAY